LSSTSNGDSSDLFILKIADWGLGRSVIQPGKPYTPEVKKNLRTLAHISYEE
jgi:hypothetical protein